MTKKDRMLADIMKHLSDYSVTELTPLLAELSKTDDDIAKDIAIDVMMEADCSNTIN